MMLHEVGIASRSASTSVHKVQRQRFMNHAHWTLDDWNRVLITNETRLCLRFTDRDRVWHRHGERYISSNHMKCASHLSWCHTLLTFIRGTLGHFDLRTL